LTALFAPENLTLWLSTHGAHTPLHYDSYGCNVVTQVKGSKRWQLWSPNSLRHSIHSQQTPPSSSSSSSFSPRLQKSSSSPISSTHPTSSQTNQKLPCLRIPYEESSVYSTYDPRQYNNKKVGYIPPDYDITLTGYPFCPQAFLAFCGDFGCDFIVDKLVAPIPDA
jgi:Cupin-like domain